MSAGHPHAHTPNSNQHRLRLALGITMSVLALQIIGGMISGSVALLADAAHMAADTGALALALFAASMTARPASSRRTYGWQRVEVLAALINASILLAVAGWIILESVSRIGKTHEIQTDIMLATAAAGLIANAIALRVLSGSDPTNLNLRAARLEVAMDLLGSCAVILAAGMIALTGWVWLDAAAAIGIAALIIPRTLRLLQEAGDVLLEATPRGMDLDQVREHMMELPGVIDVHDLHAWTISSGRPVLSAHVVMAPSETSSGESTCSSGASATILDQLSACLAGHFDVEHCTFQIEPEDHSSHELGQC